MDPNLNPATTPKSGSKSHANANTSSQQRGHTGAPTVSNQNGKNSDGSIHMATLFSEKVPATKARKRSCTDCLMRHIPFYMKVLQVAAINVSMLYLTKIDQVKKAINYSSFWTVILAVTLQFFTWLLYENFAFTLTTRRKKLRLTAICTIIYTICMSYIALYCYLSFNKTHVTIGVACLSVLYLGTLLFRLMLKKPPGGETHNRRATVTSHFGITRPQTNDTRLNIGPQLVFPIPEEYSTPGARHQNERKTSSD